MIAARVVQIVLTPTGTIMYHRASTLSRHHFRLIIRPLYWPRCPSDYLYTSSKYPRHCVAY